MSAEFVLAPSGSLLVRDFGPRSIVAGYRYEPRFDPEQYRSCVLTIESALMGDGEAIPTLCLRLFGATGALSDLWHGRHVRIAQHDDDPQTEFGRFSIDVVQSDVRVVKHFARFEYE
ncbi:MAG: hypothetical protein KA144_02675 [Xanthomonadaceae bacterium]|nr:hypothetical protein [Xanthomonadaceae bacterium]